MQMNCTVPCDFGCPQGRGLTCSILVDGKNGIGTMDVAGSSAPLCALAQLGSDADKKKDETEIKIQSCCDSRDTLCSVNTS